MAHNGCFAVFDGHGGHRAAQFCQERMAAMLESHYTVETKTYQAVSEGKYSQL